MDRELWRNGSGYADPTAYKAMMNYQEEEVDLMINREFRRGEIFEYELANGNIKKALIVSADYRADSGLLSVLMLFDEAGNDDCVPIVCGGLMYADARKVSYAQERSFLNFIKEATADEMKVIDSSLMKVLGLSPEPMAVKPLPTLEVTADAIKMPIIDDSELVKAKAEAEIYKGLYEQLLSRVIS